ncbi:MAG: B12-binding domain-containing radical SAM protein [bacterium]|nr:B12-binding domain-containing radical SAM protein [bacterium]
MKIMLINAPRINSIWCGVPDIFNGKDQHLFPPQGIMYLSAYLKRDTDHEIKILDPNAELIGHKEIEKRIRDFDPEVVGITTMTHNLIDVWECVKSAKRVNPEIHVVLGGPHAARFQEEAIALEGVDSIVFERDGEEPFAELIEAVEGKRKKDDVLGAWFKNKDGSIIRNGPRPINKNLSRFPQPDRTGIDLKAYYTPGMKGLTATTIVTSRGCPNGCNFCLSTSAFAMRTPSDIVDEMIACKEMGIGEVLFVDDIFNVPQKRVTEISKEILRRGVKMPWGFKGTIAATTYEMLEIAKEAGCIKGHFGVESGTEESLASLGKSFMKLEKARQVFKWCKELDMIGCAYIMIGTPAEKNRDDIMRTVDFVYQLDPAYVVYAITSPYPDTPLWQKGAELKLWDGDLWKRFMANPTIETADPIPTMWNQHMSREELLTIFKEINRDFYFNPVKIARTLAQATNYNGVKRIFQGGLAIAKLQLMKASGHRI